jgi:hypothetical protein
MTPEDAKARDEAIEALIVSSLRAPDQEKEISDEVIRRYVDQNVTLSEEDNAALDKARVEVLSAVGNLFNTGHEADCEGLLNTGEKSLTESAKGGRRTANDEFVGAIVIAQLTRFLANSEHPLGRMRYNKFAYLSHRKAEEDVSQHFLKKAAGPYSPWARYKGPEDIALRNGYVKRAKSGNYTGLVPGDKIDRIDQYVTHYPVCTAVEWAVSKFRFRKKERLELLATVDFAALDLVRAELPITIHNIKHIIATNKDWAPKLDREVFSDCNISDALNELKSLYPSTYA